MRAEGVGADQLDEQREEREQEAAFANEGRKVPARCAFVCASRQREREGRAHRKKKKWKHEVNPGDAGQRTVECEVRWRHLRVIHPGRERVRIEWQLAGQEHREDGEAAQRIQCEGAGCGGCADGHT